MFTPTEGHGRGPDVIPDRLTRHGMCIGPGRRRAAALTKYERNPSQRATARRRRIPPCPPSGSTSAASAAGRCRLRSSVRLVVSRAAAWTAIVAMTPCTTGDRTRTILPLSPLPPPGLRPPDDLSRRLPGQPGVGEKLAQRVRFGGLDHVAVEPRLLGSAPVLLLPPARDCHQDQVLRSRLP